MYLRVALICNYHQSALAVPGKYNLWLVVYLLLES